MLAIFEFNGQQVRWIDGKPVANDVAKVLGYKDPSDAVAYDCYSVFDLLAIAIEFTENKKLQKAEEVFKFIRTYDMIQDATSERLYHAVRIHFAWQESRINESDKNKVKFVYLIGCKANKTMKIGISSSPDKRISQLQTSSSFPLTLLATLHGSISLERQLHREFAHLYIKNEWFKWSDDILQKFENLQALQ